MSEKLIQQAQKLADAEGGKFRVVYLTPDGYYTYQCYDEIPPVDPAVKKGWVIVSEHYAGYPAARKGWH